MIKVDPSSGMLMFWHCQTCFEEKGDASARDYSRLSVGVGAFGELIVWCNRHNHLVLRVENGKIDNEIMGMVDEGHCDSCDESCECEGKETLH